MYSHFLSIFKTEMAQLTQILPHGWQEVVLAEHMTY